MESRRRVVAALSVAAVALIVAGVAAVAIDTGSTGGPSSVSPSRTGTQTGSHSVGTPSPSSSPAQPSSSPQATPTAVVPTPSLGPTPTARPTGFSMRGGSVVYYTADGTIVPMEAIPGLTTAIFEGRALYYAQLGNPYGLVTGSYAGEFMPNVTMEQADGSSAQTGGIVVVGPVANRLIANALAAYTDPTQRWIVALPVDIRGASKSIDVSFDQFGLHGWSDTPRVTVRFSGQLPVVEVIPTNAGYHVLVEQLGVTSWQIVDPTRLSLSQTALDQKHLMNELLIYGTGTASTRTDVMVNRRIPVGRPMVSATGEVSVSLVVPDSRADLGPDRILVVKDVPVFVAST